MVAGADCSILAKRGLLRCVSSLSGLRPRRIKAVTVSRSRAYLDYNATAPLHPAAKAAMCAALEQSGNASSVHAEGRAARALIETARIEVAKLVGARPKSTFFTSGGTEALNLALTPCIETVHSSKPVDVLLVGAGEHAAVLSGHRFAKEKVEEIA